MIAGHAPLAFALAGLCARYLGYPRRRALEIGLLAFGFAVVPDVDIIHALVGFFGSVPSDPLQVDDVFWSASQELHRGITHSLVVGLTASLGFGLVRAQGPWRLLGGVLLAGVLGLGVMLGGVLGLVMTGLFLLAGFGVVVVAGHLDVGPAETLVAGAIGLLTHPFGDVFTGTPPDMLQPLMAGPLADRLVLVGDPTLNLLAVFALELLCIWVGVAVAGRLLEVTIHRLIAPTALSGLGYGLAAVVLPPPSIDVAEPFVFSVLAVGVVGISPLLDRVDRETIARGFLTGFTAVTLGGVGYTVVYLIT